MWVATFQKDTELEDVGTVSAVWTANGESFTVPARRVDQKGLAEFVTAAKAALAAWQAQRAKVTTISAKVTAALNA